MSNPEVRCFSSLDALDEALADKASKILHAAISQRGRASLVVSGGSTPIGFFQRLSKSDIAWERVSIWLADERWVDSQDSASNEKLVRTHLLQNRAANARFISFTEEHFSQGLSAQHGALALQKKYAGEGDFDLVILGMGQDAHTASLFPEIPQLDEGLDVHSEVHYIGTRAPVAPQERLSMTLARIVKAKRVVVHITGQAKAHVIKDAWLNDNVFSQPVAAFLKQKSVSVNVYCDYDPSFT